MARSCYVASLREDGVGGQVLPIEDLDIRENDEKRGKRAEDLVLLGRKHALIFTQVYAFASNIEYFLVRSLRDSD